MCGSAQTNRFTANAAALIAGLEARAVGAKLNEAQNLAQFLAQVAHESGRFYYDEEVWGPTVAQRRYDIRTDLGNTAARDGDGEKFKGRASIMVTGGTNYRLFRDWCRALFPHLAVPGLRQAVPDFVAEPERILEDPWEGLAPIWFWETNDLDRYARTGNIEMVTKTVNGGLNGYADRLALYPRCALVLLDYKPDAVRAFQREHGLAADGIPGPRTRSALHDALLELPHWFPSETGAEVVHGDAPVITDGALHVLSAPEALEEVRGILASYDLSQAS
ncbi:glycoside hydrolase family 19 protein [Salipiger sp. IMCC34102]|nr:glycoside hydrolase family 19 protein [Salipiger sp. IMCC34102]